MIVLGSTDRMPLHARKRGGFLPRQGGAAAKAASQSGRETREHAVVRNMGSEKRNNWDLLKIVALEVARSGALEP